jgi:hypothetical protein
VGFFFGRFKKVCRLDFFFDFVLLLEKVLGNWFVSKSDKQINK